MTPADEDALVELAWKEDAKSLSESIEPMLRFAIRAAVAHERERCAKVCDKQEASGDVDDLSYEIATIECAAAIRRGE